MDSPKPDMLEHGGRLREAARRFNIPLPGWLDLSTGINPVPYPVPLIPADIWQRLPEEEDGLAEAAARYYGSHALLPVAGSQAAIQALPALIPGSRVTLLAPTYAEHPHAWRKHQTTRCAPEGIEAALPHTDILVIANPNNPSGAYFHPDQLMDWHHQLSQRDGWLIVDEAFIDTTPEYSVIPFCARGNMVILRSLGKFFGLAGARVGFVFTVETLRRKLAQQLGPWTISGPSRYAASKALADLSWQQSTRLELIQTGKRLHELLRRSGLGEPRGTPLFQWVITPHADELYERFARQGILVRRFTNPASLRFGLPPDETGWQRLSAALNSCI